MKKIIKKITAMAVISLSLIHITEPTRRTTNSYAVFRLKKKTKRHLLANETDSVMKAVSCW